MAKTRKRLTPEQKEKHRIYMRDHMRKPRKDPKKLAKIYARQAAWFKKRMADPKIAKRVKAQGEKTRMARLERQADVVSVHFPHLSKKEIVGILQGGSRSKQAWQTRLKMRE